MEAQRGSLLVKINSSCWCEKGGKGPPTRVISNFTLIRSKLQPRVN